MVMRDYQRRTFTAAMRNGKSVTHDVYSRGEGAPVVLIQELPGIGMETLNLSDKLREAGHKVVMPHLFGPLGRTNIVGNLARVLCMRNEFSIFAKNQSSPVVDWLRALCRDVRDREGVEGVGVIGMCLTGNFVITLIGDDSVLAAVASQPAMPAFPQRCIHMSKAEVERSRQGIDDSGPMLAFRFEGDPMVTAAKFAGLDKAFNEPDNERIRLDVLPGKGHSVLTVDFVDREGHPTHEALQKILGYFSERLTSASRSASTGP